MNIPRDESSSNNPCHSLTLMEAAIKYAKRGYRVLPLHSPNKIGVCSCGNENCQNVGKHPRTQHGFKDASCDPEIIQEWWGRWPNANIGLVTGKESDLLVLDVDPRHGGDESLKKLQEMIGLLPETTVAHSGSGGSHYFFKYPPNVDIGNSTCVGGFEGLDIRGRGGYIVAAPSLHVSGGRYEFISDLSHIAPVPQPLLDLIHSNHHSNAGDTKKLDTESILNGVPEGKRNESIFTLACRMLRAEIPQPITEETCLKAASNCTPKFPEAETLDIVRRAYENYSYTVGDWPKPDDLGKELPPVQSFYPELLPESFRPAVEDIADRMQVPLDFPGVALVVTLAGTVNRRATIQPKAQDNSWKVIPNQWGGVVAPPGFMKSPTLSISTKPLRDIEARFRKQFEQELIDFQSEKEIWELKRNAYRQKATSAFKSNHEPPPAIDPLPEEPKPIRLIINDATFEATHEIMSTNPAGILIVRDELSGFIAQMERPGREDERAFHLQAWNGDTDHTIDRIGRGSIYVPDCCESMLGGIQPNKLRTYLVDTLNGGPGDDGFIQRFQLLVWPDFPTNWELVDRPPNSAALLQIESVLLKLIEINPEHPLKFRFSHDAQELFNDWHSELEQKIRDTDMPPALAGHLSKFRKTMPALALLFQLADMAVDSSCEGFVASPLEDSQKFGEVSLEHTKQAAAWCEYLESQARRIYSCIITPQMRSAHALAQKIKERKIGSDGSFTLREVYLKGWAGLNTPELVKAAVPILQDAGWIRPLSDNPDPRGGRQSMRFEINPKVRK